MRRFFLELKRRRVYQTLGLYVIGAWALLQVTDLAFESLGLADIALRPVWVACIVFFPIALLFGWRYDISTQGIARTPATVDAPALPLGKLDYSLLLGIGVALAITAVAIAQQVRTLPNAEAHLPPPPAAHSIAVLPFRQIGGDASTSAFTDGIHDDLLTSLAKIGDLKVISRTSVLQYRDTQKNLRQIGRELGAANILEGGIQHVGGAVRINVQLINAQTDEHLWAENYDRPMTVDSLFDIQTEIAETIAQSLAITLSVRERSSISTDRTDNLEAFGEFSRGRKNFARRSFEGLRAAERHFSRAVELDPEYFLARVMLARTYVDLADTGAETFEYATSNGRAHIDYAMQLNPNDGHAVATFAQYEEIAGADSAHALFERAVSLEPNNVEVLDIYSSYLRRLARYEDAIRVTERALQFDPLSTTLWHDLGRARVSLGRFEEANQAFSRIAQIDPDNPYASHGAALATILGGQLVEAAYWGEINAATDKDDYENTGTLTNIYMSIGDMQSARAALDRTLELGPNQPMPLAVQAIFLTMTERSDEAVTVARTALANGLDDRWGSERVFLRTLRDEVLRSGAHAEAIGWYRRLQPGLFADEPEVPPAAIQRAADLGGLLLAAGDEERGRRLLEEVIAVYDDAYVRGAANWPMGIAKAEALALLGRDNAALTELQRVVDDGWRLLWQWDTIHNRNFDSVRGNPRFTALLDRIREDMAAQAAAFEPPV